MRLQDWSCIVEEAPTLLAALINWTPFIVWLILSGYIAVLMRRYIRQRAVFQESMLDHMQRHTQAIERIAAQAVKATP